jgi:hypothetical protein
MISFSIAFASEHIRLLLDLLPFLFRKTVAADLLIVTSVLPEKGVLEYEGSGHSQDISMVPA